MYTILIRNVYLEVYIRGLDLLITKRYTSLWVTEAQKEDEILS
jgi:hypothetical protein